MGLDALPTIDWALRGAAAVLLLLLAGLLARDHGRSLAARIGAGFAFGVAAYAVVSGPGMAEHRAWWQAPFWVLASGNAFVFWLFARALFDDEFAARRWHALVWAGFGVGSLACFAVPGHIVTGFAAALLTAGRIGFALLAVGQTIATWRADLVEGRRRLRLFIVGAVALHIVIDAAGSLAAPAVGLAAGPLVIGAATLLLMTLAIGWPLLGIGGGDLFGGTPGAMPAGVALPSAPAVAAERLPEAIDGKLLAALQRLMAVERAHRREGLTIGVLAVELGLPEYRLRRAINQGLGFRNFNAFLNHYRIAEVKQALRDPGQAEVPLLTMAMDAGFQSLGPFNRAFKAETGLTPSEFRRLHGSEAAGKPLAEHADFEISKTA